MIAGVVCVVLGGCCDQAAVQACLANRAKESAAWLAAFTVVNAPDEPMQLSVAHAKGVEVDVVVVDALCQGGRGADATVEVRWKVNRPGVQDVRILVGSGHQATKTWVEAGASGTQRTGPWIGDGALLRMESAASAEPLALVRVEARPCR